MTQKLSITLISALVLAFGFTAGGAFAENTNHPCAQVRHACQQAGFSRGQWKKGYGIARDCVNPIMQGQTNVPGATKALPSVDPSVVSACKAKRPKFGSGKIGS